MHCKHCLLNFTGTFSPIRKFSAAIQKAKDAVIETSNVREHAASELCPVIGLEIHAQLHSRTKLFSASDAVESPTIESNAYCTAFDYGIPGTLPRLSRSCVEKAILAAVLLNCEVANYCRFDRKHYFYPDLPLGYQITQKESPIAKNGHLDFFAQHKDGSAPSSSIPQIYEKSVRIQQIQLEIDSGKTIRNGDVDLLDLNRANLALIEIVTAPDFRNSQEVACFVEHLRLLLAMNGICAGHEGNLRVDANVSVSIGDDPGVRTELKNLSTVSHLQLAINNELRRQMKALAKGERIQPETRAVDAQGQTISARAKDSQMDYRFMPEPNLPPLAIEPKWLENAKAKARPNPPHLVYVEEHGFPPLLALGIQKSKKSTHFFETYFATGQSVPFRQLSPWLNELEFLCQKLDIDYPPADNQMIRHFAEIVSLECHGRLTKLVGIELLREFATHPESMHGTELTKLVEERQLWRITDPDKIRGLVESAIAEQNADFMGRLVAGKNKPLAKLKRQVIEGSGKRVSPEDVETAIRHVLESANANQKSC